MQMLRLLEELTDLVLAQKTLLGVTCNFRQEDFLSLINKIRATMIPASSPELIMEATRTVLTRHLRSQEEVTSVMSEIQSAIGG